MPGRRTKGGARSSIRNAPLWQRILSPLLITVGGRLVLLSTLAALVFWQRGMLVYHVARLGGYGTYPIVLWAVVFIITVRLQPRWLLRWWQWYSVTALGIATLVAMLGAGHASEGVLHTYTLGGIAGKTLWGNTPIQGVPVVTGLLILMATVLWPRHAYNLAKKLLLAMWTAMLSFLRRLPRLVWQGIRAAGRASLRGIAYLVPPLRRWVKATPPKAPASPTPEVQLATEPSVPAEGVTTSPILEVDGVHAKAKAGTSAKGTPGQNGQKAATSGAAWRLPSTSLLDNGRRATVKEEETDRVARKIEETLGYHGVEVTVDQIKPGPTVTLYGLTPGWNRKTKETKERDKWGNILRDAKGRPMITRKEEQSLVRVDNIVAREKDLALALAAPSLRIQAPVPGESVVGIEVPNHSPSLVTVRSVMDSPTFQDIVTKGGLPLALGQGSGGDPIATDLRGLPHLLIAGATGSGKSVCINAVIVSLVSQVSPERMRLVLIDPKRVELTPFNGLPHLAIPVVVDTAPAVSALKGVLREMLRRYKRLEELGVRNIEGYRSHPGALEAMPYLVIAIDEMADLMMAAPYEIEQTLCRLAQLGRATGIHIIAATQRPSVDVVTGLIKANFPSRISFAVVSMVDSRTILDSGGAERLLGKGDMLFLSHESPKPQRVQGAYVSDKEIGRLMQFWRTQNGPPLPPLNLEPPQEGSHNDGEEETESPAHGDDLMDKAMELASRYTHLSTSLLQRRLRIGYPRAARLMDQLEDAGVIGPGDQGKSREVLKRSSAV
ncbi:MAG: DNA translocase FtsK [Dehalococcoidia bacterium]|nr:DNA translocase FtsK [Dehalococcoidia bacterium]